MNESNLDDFLDGKKKIVFPLLDEVIKLFKKLNINNYEIFYNVIKFKYIYSDFILEYDKDGEYCITENGSYSYVGIDLEDLAEYLELYIKYLYIR